MIYIHTKVAFSSLIQTNFLKLYAALFMNYNSTFGTIRYVTLFVNYYSTFITTCHFVHELKSNSLNYTSRCLWNVIQHKEPVSPWS